MESFLQTAQSYSQANSTADCCGLLDDFVKSGEFLCRTNFLLSDPVALASVAHQSNFHTNHFSKIVLAKYGGWNLRLHVWPVRPHEQIHEPHNHRWNFSSHVLMGTIVNQTLEERNDGIPHDKYIAHATALNRRRPYDLVGSVGLITHSQEIHEAGVSYFHRAGIVHIARIPANIVVATLFLTAPPQKDSSLIYMPDRQTPPGDIVLAPLSPDDVAARLRTITKTLKGLSLISR